MSATNPEMDPDFVRELHTFVHEVMDALKPVQQPIADAYKLLTEKARELQSAGHFEQAEAALEFAGMVNGILLHTKNVRYTIHSPRMWAVPVVEVVFVHEGAPEPIPDPDKDKGGEKKWQA